MSVAGEGLTEPNIYLRLSVQMQTSLATWTKSHRFPENGGFTLLISYYFCTAAVIRSTTFVLLTIRFSANMATAQTHSSGN